MATGDFPHQTTDSHALRLRSRPPFTGVLLGPGCFLGNFGHLPRSAPKSAFSVLFGILRPKKRQKALKKRSLGHSEAGAQNCPKNTPGGTLRPGP